MRMQLRRTRSHAGRVTMKIGRREPAVTANFFRRNLKWFGVLILAFVIGLVFGILDWHEVIRRLQSAPGLVARSVVPSDDLPTLAVDMSFTNYDGILGQRQGALESGVYIPSAQDFVTATVRLDDAAVPVRMRLLAGPADHLGEDEKWGFEVRTRNNQLLLGMQRLYLLDPAVNNWLDQWAFSRALEREGVLVARYRFVHLIFNGDDRGIYALQEGFGEELLTTQGRPTGVIVEFDADLLWRSIAHFQGDAQAACADPVANLSAADFQYFEVDPFRDATIASDPDLSAQRDAAIGLLRALQAGRLQASDVFDVEQYGRFLASTDLWGATEGTSLVNLRYYYNPVSARLEPVGFNANALGSDARLSLAATYDDPTLQTAYVQEAWRISQPEYLDELQSELEPEWRRLQRTLSARTLKAEYEGLEPPWDALRRRQERIRRSLEPVQPVFAYLGSPTSTVSGTLRVDVANVLNLPVEIMGFDVHGATYLPVDRWWLKDESTELLTAHTDRVILRAFDSARTPVIRYAHFEIPLAEIHRLDNEFDFMQEVDIQVATRILGLSTTHLTLAQRGYPDVFIGGAEK